MEEILALLQSDPKRFVETVKAQTKKREDIENYIKEYKDFDRNQRSQQLEAIQQDKTLEAGTVAKMVKIYLNHAQNIVETLSAFIIGKPVTLLPSENNDLAKLVKQIWRVNRLDAKILQSTILKLSETQVAMHFYIADSEKTSLLNKVLSFLGLKVQAKEIKVKVLDNSAGVMTPYFDTTGDMKLFMWEYETVAGDKKIMNVQVWDAEKLYNLNNITGDLALAENPLAHGFDKIPVVYDSQKEPQWYPVKSPIDRHEVALSKLGDANDYSGHPILVTEGLVENMPLKSESGKHFNIPIKLGGDDGKTVIKGSVKFLEATTAPESNKLELEKLEEAISYGSSVPNLSLEKLKSLGNVAEKTVKLMFLATDIKASLKQSETRTFVERCLNVLISGITNTTNKGMAKDAEKLYYDIQFNSILPSDIAETVTTVSSAVSSKIMSQRTAISILDLVEDVDEEMKLIKEENKVTEVVPPTNAK